jgi:hypothetical protein
MQPPDPFPPAAGSASPARAAAALASQLARHGITGIGTAATAKFAAISVTLDLTVWTNGRTFWCTHRSQRHSWPAESAAAAAARLAAFAAAPGG